MDKRSSILFLFLGLTLIVNFSQGLIEMEMSGVDGLRCDSCGLECTTVCGSRAFRSCCFNYIKKRGGPGSGPGSGGAKGDEAAKRFWWISRDDVSEPDPAFVRWLPNRYPFNVPFPKPTNPGNNNNVVLQK